MSDLDLWVKVLCSLTDFCTDDKMKQFAKENYIVLQSYFLSHRAYTKG